MVVLVYGEFVKTDTKGISSGGTCPMTIIYYYILYTTYARLQEGLNRVSSNVSSILKC